LKADGAEEILRAEFTTSPAQFTRHVLSVYATQNTFLGTKGKEQGQQFTAQGKQNEVYERGKDMFSKFGLAPEDIKPEDFRGVI